MCPYGIAYHRTNELFTSGVFKELIGRPLAGSGGVGPEFSVQGHLTHKKQRPLPRATIGPQA